MGVLIAKIFWFLVSGYIFMMFWNLLMPEIFGLPDVTILQAYGLKFMVRMLMTPIYPPHEHDYDDSAKN